MDLIPQLLSAIVISPLVGFVILLIIYTTLLPNNSLNHQAGRIMWDIALTSVLIQLILIAFLSWQSSQGIITLNPLHLLQSYNSDFWLGLDGINLSLSMMITLVTFLAILSSPVNQKSEIIALACLLLLNSGVMILLLTRDLFIFTIIWEALLLPLFILLMIYNNGIVTSGVRRFMSSQLLGAICLHLFLLGTTYHADPENYRFSALFNALTGVRELSPNPEKLILLSLLLVTAGLRFPLFPLHSWWPPLVRCVRGGSGLFLLVSLPLLGYYLLIRLALPLLPMILVQFAPILIGLSVITIIWSGMNALVQDNLRSVLAFGLLAQMGYMMIGLCTLGETNPIWVSGLSGSLLLAVSIAATTALAYSLLVMIENRIGHCRFAAGANSGDNPDHPTMAGMGSHCPKIAGTLSLCLMAMMGVPLLGSFLGKVLCLIGGFGSHPELTLVAAFGMLLGVGYINQVFSNVYSPSSGYNTSPVADLTFWELLQLLPFAVIILILGIYPNTFLALNESTLTTLIGSVKTALHMFGIG